MKVVLLFLALGGLLLAESEPPHIKAAVSAFQAGVAAERDQSYAKAIDFFLNAIEIEPTFLDPRYSLIEAYQKASKREEVAAAITQLLEIEPSASHYRLILAQMLLEAKQLDRALAQFSYLLKSDPYNADGLLGFASAAWQAGMEARASEAIELGKKHYPKDERFQNWSSGRQQ
jgi:tetratricopeptide (TPR) repeat protein